MTRKQRTRRIPTVPAEAVNWPEFPTLEAKTVIVAPNSLALFRCGQRRAAENLWNTYLSRPDQSERSPRLAHQFRDGRQLPFEFVERGKRLYVMTAKRG